MGSPGTLGPNVTRALLGKTRVCKASGRTGLDEPARLCRSLGGRCLLQVREVGTRGPGSRLSSLQVSRREPACRRDVQRWWLGPDR